MASETDKIEQTIKFGHDFELDPSLYQLRRSGRALRLERIPMEILFLLANERGRVVGRQEIADRVWGMAVCLDADNSINGAIRKIRRALRDDPERPRFIQTVTGRGYRFIAPVIENDLPAASMQVPTCVQIVDVNSEKPPAPEPKRRPISRWSAIVGIALVLIAAAGVFLWSPRANRREASHGKLRLAVLPFRNLTGDASQEYFSDGFTEEMIAQLGRLDPQHLAVIARASVMDYKDGRTPLRKIARDLDVQYVLEGSIRRDDDRVRITIQLVQVRDQTTIWARQYDRAPRDLLATQIEIASEIADNTQLTLNDRTRTTTAGRVARSPREYEAYDLYLKGRYFWSKRSEEGLQAAVYWFKQAIAKDPDYAPAYAGLADSYAIMSDYGYVPANAYMPQARVAATKALQLDDSLAEGHASLALIAENYAWDWQTAEREFRRAIRLNANYATAHHWLAECLALQGRFDEALQESELAGQLDPLSLIIAADNGAIYYFARRYDLAIARFNAVLDLDPAFGRAHMILYAYVQQGRYNEASARLQETGHLMGRPWLWASEAYVSGRSGDFVSARQDLQRLQEANRMSASDSTALLNVAYAGLGDKEKWLASLQEAYRQHTNLPTGFKVDPLYDPLRSEPRFQEMLRGAGFDRSLH